MRCWATFKPNNLIVLIIYYVIKIESRCHGCFCAVFEWVRIFIEGTSERGFQIPMAGTEPFFGFGGQWPPLKFEKKIISI